MSTQSPNKSGKSPVVAALLAVLYPGLGHVYLRRWGRALMWFGLIITAFVLLVPEAILPASLSVEAILSLETLQEARASIPMHVAAVLVVLSIMSVVDAYWIATEATREAEAARTANGDAATETRSCPHCGKELDEDLDFCHWCTTELDG